MSLIYHLSDPRDLLNLTDIQQSHGVLSMLSHMLNMQNTVKWRHCLLCILDSSFVR